MDRVYRAAIAGAVLLGLCFLLTVLVVFVASGAAVSGVLSGVGGSHAAVGYTISQGNGSPNQANAVQGVVVFAAP